MTRRTQHPRESSCFGFWLLGSCLCLVMLLVVAAADAGEFKGSIKVGVPLPLTGRHAPFGEIIKNSFVMAVDEVNAKGGVRGGYKLDLLFEDSRSDVQAARTVAEKLINQDKVVMLTGQYSSVETFPTAQMVQQYGIPFLVSTAAADEITQQGWKYIYRMVQPASEFDNGLKDLFEKVVKPKTMTILYENTLFGTSTAAAMKDWATKNRVEVAMYEPYDAGSPDYRPLLLRVKEKKADVIYMVSYLLDAVLLMRQAKEVDLNPQAFAGAAAGFSILPFIKGAGDAAENVLSSTMWEASVPYPGASAYLKDYVTRFGSPPSYHGSQGYAAVFVVADVLKRAASLSPDDIVKALAATDMMTMYGRIRFESYDKFHNQTKLPTFVIQVQKGKFVTVWPKDVATGPATYPTPPWSKR
ncbi:MAG TPA: ABC transporter substrate-binding protein [Candidatus Acidoferrum sp.]|nr:ABC transporter substrate-binding protein [Candidatus Acidoferrum sp.]